MGLKGAGLWSEFEAWLKDTEKTPQTITRYRQWFKEFVDIVGEKETYTYDDVKTFISALRRKRVSGNYLRACYYCLRSFFKNAMKWPWPGEKKDIPKASVTEVGFYTYDEIVKILGAAKRFPRDYAMVRLMWLLGCIREELCLLKREDFHPERKEIWVHGVRGHLSGARRLDDETIRALEKQLGSHNSEYLFPGRRSGKKMDADVVNLILKRACSRADVQYKGTHASRRGRVTYMKKVLGIPAEDITKILRWKSERQVFRYLQISVPEVEEEVTKRDPMFGGKREVTCEKCGRIFLSQDYLPDKWAGKVPPHICKDGEIHWEM